MTRKDMKTEVKAKLNPNFGFFFVLFLPYFILSFISETINYHYEILNVNNSSNGIITSFPTITVSISGLIAIIAYLVLVGVMFVAIDIMRNKGELNNAFSKSSTILKGHYLLPAICIGFLTAVLTFLWSILLIIPGIIKSLAYSQAQYIYRDALDKGEKISFLDAITKSRELMDGHKWEYFVLNLSFIWWYILTGITWGIAGIYVIPYVQLTNADYYNQLIKNQNN